MTPASIRDMRHVLSGTAKEKPCPKCRRIGTVKYCDLIGCVDGSSIMAIGCSSCGHRAEVRMSREEQVWGGAEAISAAFRMMFLTGHSVSVAKDPLRIPRRHARLMRHAALRRRMGT